MSRRKTPQKRYTPKPRRPERVVENEDVYPQETKVMPSPIELQIQHRRRTHNQSKVPHDYTPFNEDRMAKPETRVKFRPNKNQSMSMHPRKDKPKGNMTAKEIDYEKVTPPKRIYIPTGGEDMQGGDSGYYYRDTVEVQGNPGYEHSDYRGVDPTDRSVDTQRLPDEYVDVYGQHESHQKHTSRDGGAPVASNGIETYRVLSDYQVEVDIDGKKQAIYDAKGSTVEVRMQNAYAPNTVNTPVAVYDDQPHSSNRRHERSHQESRTGAGRLPPGIVPVMHSSDMSGDWGDYYRENSVVAASGPIWDVKTGAYDPMDRIPDREFQTEQSSWDVNVDTDVSVGNPDRTRLPRARNPDSNRAKKAYADRRDDDYLAEPENQSRSNRKTKRNSPQSKMSNRRTSNVIDVDHDQVPTNHREHRAPRQNVSVNRTLNFEDPIYDANDRRRVNEPSHELISLEDFGAIADGVAEVDMDQMRNELNRSKRRGKSKNVNSEAMRETSTKASVKDDRGARYQSRVPKQPTKTAGMVHDPYQEKLLGDSIKHTQRNEVAAEPTVVLPRTNPDQYVVNRDEVSRGRSSRNARKNTNYNDGADAIRINEDHDDGVNYDPNIIRANPQSSGSRYYDQNVIATHHVSAPDYDAAKGAVRAKKAPREEKFANERKAPKSRQGRYKTKKN